MQSELTLACRAVGIKMGHAALLINHHSTDTIMVATNHRKYNLTDARLQLVDFLLNKALLQDLWLAVLAHFYRTSGTTPDAASKRALLFLLSHSPAHGLGATTGLS